jgi:hypothetical protein
MHDHHVVGGQSYRNTKLIQQAQSKNVLQKQYLFPSARGVEGFESVVHVRPLESLHQIKFPTRQTLGWVQMIQSVGQMLYDVTNGEKHLL